MPWTTITPWIAWAAVFIALTLLYFFVKVRDRITPIVLLLVYIVINLYFQLVVNFVIVNYWLRFLPVIALIFLLLRLLDRFHRKPWLPATRAQRLALGGLVLVLVVGVWVDLLVLGSYNYPKEPVKPVLLAYPMQTGLYVIANGGSSTDGIGMNNAVRDWLGRPTGQPAGLTYGVDIMEMTARGSLGTRILSNERNDYEGWDEPVYAPCPGEVVAFENGHPDQAPLAVKDGFALGNYVVIQCFEYYVTVSNLRNGFTPVKVGEFVDFSRIVGYMGSSGAPSLPHVHVHATVGGYDLNATPVPIEFEFKFKMRNGTYVR